jgi:hypothetical protein
LVPQEEGLQGSGVATGAIGSIQTASEACDIAGFALVGVGIRAPFSAGADTGVPLEEGLCAEGVAGHAIVGVVGLARETGGAAGEALPELAQVEARGALGVAAGQVEDGLAEEGVAGLAERGVLFRACQAGGVAGEVKGETISQPIDRIAVGGEGRDLPGLGGHAPVHLDPAVVYGHSEHLPALIGRLAEEVPHHEARHSCELASRILHLVARAGDLRLVVVREDEVELIEVKLQESTYWYAVLGSKADCHGGCGVGPIIAKYNSSVGKEARAAD